MEKTIGEITKEELENQIMYESVIDWLESLQGEFSDLILNNELNLMKWKNGLDEKSYSKFVSDVNDCMNKVVMLDITIKNITSKLIKTNRL